MLIALEDIVDIDDDLDVLEKLDDQFAIVGDAFTDLVTSDGTTMEIAATLEALLPGVITESMPINSFTKDPSQTNYALTMEGIGATIKNLIKAASAAIAKLAKRMYEWLKKLFGKGSTAEQGKENARKAERSGEERSKAEDDLEKAKAEVPDEHKHAVDDKLKTDLDVGLHNVGDVSQNAALAKMAGMVSMFTHNYATNSVWLNAIDKFTTTAIRDSNLQLAAIMAATSSIGQLKDASELDSILAKLQKPAIGMLDDLLGIPELKQAVSTAESDTDKARAIYTFLRDSTTLDPKYDFKKVPEFDYTAATDVFDRIMQYQQGRFLSRLELFTELWESTITEMEAGVSEKTVLDPEATRKMMYTFRELLNELLMVNQILHILVVAINHYSIMFIEADMSAIYSIKKAETIIGTA